MRKFALIWDIITFVILAVVITLKAVAVFTFSWWWIVGVVAFIILCEAIVSIIIRKRIWGNI